MGESFKRNVGLLASAKMKNRRLIKIAFLFVTPATACSVVRSQQAQKRDLPRYDDGGAFDFAWEVAPQHENMRAKLREFIWQHWRDKRLGRVAATFHSIEGDPTTYKFYVEPDSQGQWQIVSEYETECCWFYPMEKNKRKRKLERGARVYDLVVRVANANNGGATLEEIPGSDSRAPIEYRLRLGRSLKGGNSVDLFFL